LSKRNLPPAYIVTEASHQLFEHL